MAVARGSVDGLREAAAAHSGAGSPRRRRPTDIMPSRGASTPRVGDDDDGHGVGEVGVASQSRQPTVRTRESRSVAALEGLGARGVEWGSTGGVATPGPESMARVWGPTGGTTTSARQAAMEVVPAKQPRMSDPILAQLILGHLEATGRSHVADALRDELARRNAPQEAFVASASYIRLPELVVALRDGDMTVREGHVDPRWGRPIAGPQPVESTASTALEYQLPLALGGEEPEKVARSGMGAVATRDRPRQPAPSAIAQAVGRMSSLQLLLGHSARARSCVEMLTTEARRQITQQWSTMGLPVADETYLQCVVRWAQVAMWSVEDDESLLYTRGRKNPKTGNIRFGTLNQLVEDLTSISILPLSSLPSEKGANHEDFVKAFLRQHRFFAASRWVLAKLIERFLVPYSLRLGTCGFDAHGILIHAPGTTLRRLACTSAGGQKYSSLASVWIDVAREIQKKVMSVLVLWLREFPHHFDSDMRFAVRTFVDECCYSPQLWADCPAVLPQLAEFVKAHLASIEAHGPGRWADPASATSAGVGGIFELRRPPTVGLGAALSDTDSAPPFVLLPKQAVNAVLRSGLSSDVASALQRSKEAWRQHAMEVVQLLREYSAHDYATRLTAVHHYLLRRFSPVEVQCAARCSSGAYFSSDAFLSSPFGQFFQSASDLTDWAVSVVVMSGVLDAHERRHPPRVAGEGADPLAAASATRATGEGHLIAAVEWFVDLAIQLLILNNVHAAFAVVRALEHPYVARMCRSASHDIMAFVGGGADEKRIDHFRRVTMGQVDKLVHLLSLSDTMAAEDAVSSDSGSVGQGATSPSPFGEPIQRYMAGVRDGDIHPVIPLVHVALKSLQRLTSSQPSLLLVAVNSDFPSSRTAHSILNPQESTIGLINWRRYMVEEECIRDLLVWQLAPAPLHLKRDGVWEKRHATQYTRVLVDPMTLAKLANMFLAAH